MTKDRNPFTVLETFVSVVDAISERGLEEMMAVRSERFDAGSERLEATLRPYRSNAKSSSYGSRSRCCISVFHV